MTVIERDRTAYVGEVEAWRARHTERLLSPEGFLSVVGVDWLREGDNTIGSAPESDVVLPADSAPARLGVIHWDGASFILRVTTDQPVHVNGAPATTAALEHNYSEPGMTKVTIGTVMFGVIKRRDQYGIRVWDANSPRRRNFPGRAWYPIDPAYRVRAAFTPHPARRMIEVDNTAGTTLLLVNLGVIDFELQGQPLRLEVFFDTERKEDHVWLIFRDATSGDETYEVGRFLFTVFEPDGSVIVDFNKAYHPPCYFSEFAACPIPPKENTLPIPVRAGEHFGSFRLDHEATG